MAAPTPYGRDPFSQLNRLLDSQPTAPGSIKKICLAVEDCLANNRDNLRGFFDKPFASLLKRVFGYGDFEASWLNMVTKNREADARALVDLLAPDGKLFAAMAQADSDRLVQYIFPTERLPAHTQELLKEPQGLGRGVLDGWPQYRARIRQDAAGRPQVYLNLFEYYMFWIAFYVLRGSATEIKRSDTRTTPGSASPMLYGMTGIRSVGSAIVGNLVMGRPAGALQDHPYYRLLQTYLEYFLPRSAGTDAGASSPADNGGATRAGPGAAGAAAAAAAAATGPCAAADIVVMPYGLDSPGRVMSAAGWASYKPTLTAAAAGPDSLGSVLLSVLVEFWLTDPTEPLPTLAADRISGVVQPGNPGIAPLGGLGLGAAGSTVCATGAVGAGAAGGFGGVTGSPGGVASLAGSASPTPVAVSMPPSVRMITYQPPSAELIEGLVALVRYVHVIEDSKAPETCFAAGSAIGTRTPAGVGASGAVASGRSPVGSVGRRGAVSGTHPGSPAQHQPAQAGCAPWLPETPVKTPPLPSPRVLMPPTALLVQGHSASAAVQAVSRKVYRQLRRAFSQWPPSSPTSLTSLITLWLSVLAPWCHPHALTRKAVAADAATAAGAGPCAAGGHGAGFGTQLYRSDAHARNHDHHLHHALDGASVLGSAAAAAAAGVMEATAAKLHGLSRDRARDCKMAGSTSRELLSQSRYTPAWRSHVLAHLPFYFILVPQFASLSLSRLKYRPDVALRDLDRVLAVLAAAGPELLRELRRAEVIYNDFLRRAATGGRRRSGSEFGEMVPWWLDQAQDFEAAAAAGSCLPGAALPDMAGRLFTTDASGTAYITCLMLRSAETLGRPELVAALRQSAGAVLPLESILPAAAVEQPCSGEGAVSAEGGRRLPWAGRLSALVQEDPKLADPHQLWLYLYRGRDNQHDPMLRPIASNEVATLVRPLVRASVHINAALGLDVPYTPGEEGCDPPEHLGEQVLLWARKKGYRVNLRFLAEIQTLLWLLGLVLLIYALARTCCGGGAGFGAVSGVSSDVSGPASGYMHVSTTAYNAGGTGGGQLHDPYAPVPRPSHHYAAGHQPHWQWSSSGAWQGGASAEHLADDTSYRNFRKPAGTGSGNPGEKGGYEFMT